jgi:hypothetical protein
VSKCFAHENNAFYIILEELKVSVEVIPTHRIRGGLKRLHMTNLKKSMNISRRLVQKNPHIFCKIPGLQNVSS